MKLKYALLLALSLCGCIAVHAQQVYHYRLVANVDPDTGKRTAASNNYLHITFSNNKSSLHLVDEFGQPTNVCYGTPTSQPNVFLTGTPFYVSETHYYGDYDNKYTYVRKENNIFVYVCRYSFEVQVNGVVGRSEKYESWLYFSQDFKRINKPTENTAGSNWVDPVIQVYELYDIDQASSKPARDKTGSPTVMY